MFLTIIAVNKSFDLTKGSYLSVPFVINSASLSSHGQLLHEGTRSANNSRYVQPYHQLHSNAAPQFITTPSFMQSHSQVTHFCIT